MRQLVLTTVALLAFCAFSGPTEVLFNFDTEDYTADYPNDAIRDLANLLTEEGVVGQFYVAGYLSQRLTEFGRTDVVAALKPHVVGSQTLYHSRHPAVAEYTDIPDANEAFRRALREEATCVGMLRAVFDRDSIDSYAPPGNSVSYAAMEACADLGMTFYCGGSSWGYDRDGRPRGLTALAPGRGNGLGYWYFNLYQIPYLHSKTFYLENLLLAPGPDPACGPVLDKLAGLGYCALYMHPNQAVCTTFWDVLNYENGQNLHPWKRWAVSPRRGAEETAAVYRRLRALIRAMKADSRFHITNLREIARTIKPRRTMTSADLPAIRETLVRSFGPVDVPASYSVADVFQAAVRLLRGETEYRPGRVYGFLSKPVGVTAPCRLRADDLRAVARGLDLSRYLPASMTVGSQTIGPADFLFAALDVLVSGADEVEVVPREQLGSFEHAPGLVGHRICGYEKWCIHSPDFKDSYLSDRLRYQLWTVRYE